MEFQTLKRSHLKRNIIIGVVAVGVISAIILNFTIAKYRVTQSIPLVNGTINYSLADLNIVAIYTKTDSGYTEVESIPESGYILNEEESYCKVNDTRDDNINLSYDAETKSLSVTPMTTKGTKCYLYFDEKPSIKNTLLANYSTVLTRTDFSSTVTNTTTGTIYYEDTSKGRTYYFAGNPTDNWVKFGGFYWRIIRINEDGSVRMIFQGTSPNTTGGTTVVSNSFNITYNDINNMYVGYMYQNGDVHGLITNSSIKSVLDTWYQNNLTSYASKIDGNAGFCGDRQPSTSSSTSNGSGGTGTTTTYYGGYIRLITNKQPTFECTNDSDLYTTIGSSDGNKKLTFPIGLISADEVAYAGGLYSYNNVSYYLFTNSTYWTMSPSYYYSDFISVFAVTTSGYLYYNWVGDKAGVRPVINLKADVTITGGTGTSSNPYIIN